MLLIVVDTKEESLAQQCVLWMLNKLIKLGNIIHSSLNRYVVCIVADNAFLFGGNKV